IWAIGISMVLVSGLVFLPNWVVFAIGMILVFGHNLLDPITFDGASARDVIWYAFHQPHSVFIDSTHLIDFVYPVLPWIGLMALGYVFGSLYRTDLPAEQRRRWLLSMGVGAISLFLILRGLNFYGEPHQWKPQNSFIFGLMSFLNTTKYPPSLQFL